MWTCPRCKTRIEREFEACWACGAPNPGSRELNLPPAAAAEYPGSPAEPTGPPPGSPSGPVTPTRRRVGFKLFRSSLLSWESLFAQAAEFASTIGPRRLISISHSEDRNEGVVAVWYWEKRVERPD